jgi:hypothetical protein
MIFNSESIHFKYIQTQFKITQTPTLIGCTRSMEEVTEKSKELNHLPTVSLFNSIPLIRMKNADTPMIAREKMYANILHHHGSITDFKLNFFFSLRIVFFVNNLFTKNFFVNSQGYLGILSRFCSIFSILSLREVLFFDRLNNSTSKIVVGIVIKFVMAPIEIFIK